MRFSQSRFAIVVDRLLLGNGNRNVAEHGGAGLDRDQLISVFAGQQEAFLTL
jgi:hypothetical protein